MLRTIIYNESIKVLTDSIADLAAIIEESRYNKPDHPVVQRLGRIKDAMIYAMEANKEMEILCQDIETYKEQIALLTKVDRYRHSELNKYKMVESLILTNQLDKIMDTVKVNLDQNFPVKETISDEISI